MIRREDKVAANICILVVDDEAHQRNILRDILADAGFEVITAADGASAIEILEEQHIPLILTDLKMPDVDGFELLQKVLKNWPESVVIIMTAFGTIPSAVNAIKNGAYDYLTKPFNKGDLLRVITRAAEKVALLEENRRLREQVQSRHHFHELIGKSAAMQTVYRLIDRIKDVDATVLIHGESGTGKELAARAIHFRGKRREGPFVAVNCGAIPEMLIESELFGHEKGAFTGAVNQVTGKFEQAQGGTLFLDEIGAMPLSLQVRLLRVLQEKAIERVGGNRKIALDVRVIAASNQQLPELVAAGKFRLDLYHRLNVFSLELPPLRERGEDVILLARHFIEKYAQEYGRPRPKMSPGAIARLESYSFPGNVRELQNIIEKTLILNDVPSIGEEDLLLPQPEPGGDESDEQLSLVDREIRWIRAAMSRAGGSIKNAAQELGISYKTLQYRLKKYGLDRNQFR